MKKLFYLALAAMVVVGCSDKKVNGWTSNGLKGPVKTVTFTTFEAKMRFGEVEKGRLLRKADKWLDLHAGLLGEFNADGYLTKRTAFDSDGDITELVRYIYQGDKQTAMYTYDRYGDVNYSIETILEDGKPVGLKRYIAYGDERETIKDCVFDGMRILSYKVYVDDELKEIIENEFKNGMLSHSATINADGEITFELFVEFTENGQMTYRRVISHEEEVLVEHYTYDDNLLMHYTRSGAWEDDEIDYTFEYTSFDKKGNWLTRLIHKDDEPIFLQERMIEYY